ncbi:septal ring lytic transglycosylase RlpA family protein [Qipengyuania sp. CAU 1752]
MRLPNDVHKAAIALGLSAMVAACAGGTARQDLASADGIEGVRATAGPEADYPQVLGEAFSVDGQIYTPEDTYSYDAVGYASFDGEGGSGISVAHKTLPLPSYVELTSLETGRTVLARVERRGPMTSQRLVALSAGASAELGVANGAPVRVRRVNPQEFERAQLRSGGAVPARLDTPEPLLAVLRKKLPATGAASLAGSTSPRVGSMADAQVDVPASTAAQPSADPQHVIKAQPAQAAAPKTFDTVFESQREPNRAYPLPPLALAKAPAKAGQPTPVTTPVLVAPTPEVQRFTLSGTQTSKPAQPEKLLGATRPVPDASAPDRRAVEGAFVVQAAAFSSKASAERLAGSLDGGFVMQSGKYFRVRTGPYATRGQAEAALAKVRAAGYSDARVFSAG